MTTSVWSGRQHIKPRNDPFSNTTAKLPPQRIFPWLCKAGALSHFQSTLPTHTLCEVQCSTSIEYDYAGG